MKKSIFGKALALLAASALVFGAVGCSEGIGDYADENPATWYSYTSAATGSSTVTAKWTFAADNSSIGTAEVGWSGNKIAPDEGSGAQLVGGDPCVIKYVAPSGTLNEAMGASTGRIQAANKTANITDLGGAVLRLFTTDVTDITVRAAGAGAATATRILVIQDASTGEFLCQKDNLANGSYVVMNVQGAPKGEYLIHFNGSTLYEIDCTAKGSTISQVKGYEDDDDLILLSGEYEVSSDAADTNMTVKSTDVAKFEVKIGGEWKENSVPDSGAATFTVDGVTYHYAAVSPTDVVPVLYTTAEILKLDGSKETVDGGKIERIECRWTDSDDVVHTTIPCAALVKKISWDATKYGAWAITRTDSKVVTYKFSNASVTYTDTDGVITSTVSDNSGNPITEETYVTLLDGTIGNTHKSAFKFYKAYNNNKPKELEGLIGSTLLALFDKNNNDVTANAVWTSSDSDIASVSKGVVSAIGKKTGKATITARIGRFSKSVDVVVTEPKHSIVTTFNAENMPAASTKILPAEWGVTTVAKNLQKMKVGGLADPLVTIEEDAVAEISIEDALKDSEDKETNVSKGATAAPAGFQFKDSLSSAPEHGTKFVSFTFTVKPAEGKTPKLDGITGLLNCGKGEGVMAVQAYIGSDAKGKALVINKNQTVSYNNIDAEGTKFKDKGDTPIDTVEDVGGFGEPVTINDETKITITVEYHNHTSKAQNGISLQIQDIGLTFTE